MGAVRNFWSDNHFPYFLVTLAPYDQDQGGSDGTAFTNAFWMFVSPHSDLHGLLPSLAHESFHAWDPDRMGVEPTGYNEGLNKWFREGPTDYYAHLLTYRAGMLSAAGYIDYLNTLLRRFSETDDEYVRGPVISLWLDGAIRNESNEQHSLDTVMFDMVKGSDQQFTLDRILEVADQYLSAESRILLKQAVVSHGPLAPPEYLPGLHDCARSSLDQLPTFDLGFDYADSIAKHVVAGVSETGPAFRAGLRDGQRLGRHSVYYNDPSRMATFTVHLEDGDKQIAFYPRGKSVQVWQYHVDKSNVCR